MRNKTQLWMIALAVFAALMLGSPAQAKTWVATYDPPAYIGTGTFEVDDACLAGPDGEYTQLSAGCPIAIMITGNLSTSPLVDFAPILPRTLCVGCTFAVLGGKFAGVDTGVIGVLPAGSIGYEFEFSYTPIYVNLGNTRLLVGVENIVNLYQCAQNGDGYSCDEVRPIYSAPGPPPNGFVRFDAVPEPGSLALIFGAMGAGWLVRRRKAAF
jgi:hypothetical protein